MKVRKGTSVAAAGIGTLSATYGVERRLVLCLVFLEGMFVLTVPCERTLDVGIAV
jgi:4-hydroxybenzoate polyprenyltransferase